MKLSDSITKACVLAIAAIVYSNPALAYDPRAKAILCSNPENAEAQLLSFYRGEKGLLLFPGNHEVREDGSTLSWSSEEATFVLKAGRLVAVSDTAIATTPCVDVTVYLTTAADRAVRESPELLERLDREALVFALKKSEANRAALQAQVDATPFNNLPETPLCKEIVKMWDTGAAQTLKNVFGNVVEDYVKTCTPG